MLPITYLNGAYVAKSDSKLHVSDLSILRGYGIFDYFRYTNGRPFFLTDHINRFSNSAKQMGLELPIGKTELEEVVFQLIQRNELMEGGIRMVMTGGYAADAYTPSEPNLLAMAYAHKAPDPRLYQQGCTVLLHQHLRQIPNVKTTDYIEGIRLLPKLAETKADFPVYIDPNNMVRESDRSNIMIVKDGVLITPQVGVLGGITRKHILILAEAMNIPVELRQLNVAEFLSADEAIICSSTKGVMPIARTTEQEIGTHCPGPITKRLMDAWTPYTLAENRNDFLQKLSH